MRQSIYRSSAGAPAEYASMVVILIVEDDEPIRELVELILEDGGYET
jgi:PleD family two-component response regulator